MGRPSNAVLATIPGVAVESILFAFDSLAVVLLVWFSLPDDLRREGEAQTGLFRYRQEGEDAPAGKPGTGRRPAESRAR